MKFVNLTPHAITIMDDAGNAIRTIEPSGHVARANTYTKEAGDIDGVPVVKQSFGNVEGVPEPAPGTVYLVSMVVGQALAGTGRTDIFGPDTSPFGAVRDDSGRIIGTRRLVAYG